MAQYQLSITLLFSTLVLVDKKIPSADDCWNSPAALTSLLLEVADFLLGFTNIIAVDLCNSIVSISKSFFKAVAVCNKGKNYFYSIKNGYKS